MGFVGASKFPGVVIFGFEIKLIQLGDSPGGVPCIGCRKAHPEFLVKPHFRRPLSPVYMLIVVACSMLIVAFLLLLHLLP